MNKLYIFTKASSVKDLVKSTLSDNDIQLGIVNVNSIEELLSYNLSDSIAIVDYDLISEDDSSSLKLKDLEERLIILTSDYSVKLSDYLKVDFGVEYVITKPIMPSILTKTLLLLETELVANPKDMTLEEVETVKTNESKDLNDDGVEVKKEEEKNLEITTDRAKEIAIPKSGDGLTIRPPRFNYENPIEDLLKEKLNKEKLEVPMIVDDMEVSKNKSSSDIPTTKEILGNAFSQIKKKFFS